MDCKKLMRIGISGSIVTAICCFTPILVVLFGAVGLSAWLGWTGRVLPPLLVGFIGLTAYAANRMRKECPPAAAYPKSTATTEQESPITGD